MFFCWFQKSYWFYKQETTLLLYYEQWCSWLHISCVKTYSKVQCADYISKTSFSQFFYSLNSVCQVCVISPFLLELQSMIEDNNLRGILVVPEFLEILLLLYADDLCFIDDCIVQLQRKVNILDSFCKKWGQQVNLDTTEVMGFRNGDILRHCEKWSIGEVPITVTTYYNYLGVL